MIAFHAFGVLILSIVYAINERNYYSFTIRCLKSLVLW